MSNVGRNMFMKRVLRSIVLVIVAAVIFAPVGAFADKKESRFGFNIWKPWKYFWNHKTKDTERTKDVDAVDLDVSDSSVADENVSGDIGVVSKSRPGVGNSIYLYDGDEFGRVKKVIDDEFIGEYRLNREYNDSDHIREKNSMKGGPFSEDMSVCVSRLKINDDYTGSFKIGLGEEKKFKIERQGNRTYMYMLSDKGDKLGYKYLFKTERIGDRYVVIFDDIYWKKSGVYSVPRKHINRGEFGELISGFEVEVPHIGCPTKEEAKINIYFSKVLRNEYNELKYIRDKVRTYFYASTSYDVKYDKNNIFSVFREREIDGGPGMRGRTSAISYKSFAEVFDKARGCKLDLIDVLCGSKEDIDEFILDCYRGDASKADSIKVSFGFTEDELEYSDRDILNGVSFYVDDNDLVFVVDVFDGSRLEIGKAIHRINIEENDDLFTERFLESYRG